MRNNTAHIGAILPHLRSFGGVRRFFEIGNTFIERGFRYTIFAEDTTPQSWFDYKGAINDWKTPEVDFMLLPYYPNEELIRSIKGKIFVYVVAGGEFLDGYSKLYGSYPFIVNNREFLSHYPKATLIEGGVNISHFSPGRKLRVGYFASERRKTKGVEVIEQELSPLENIQLVGIEGYTNSELPKVYRSLDYFVSHETRLGWSNTMAEALACGIPVVCSGMNATPFKERVIQVKSLRAFFEDPMLPLSWQSVCDQLMHVFLSSGTSSETP